MARNLQWSGLIQAHLQEPPLCLAVAGLDRLSESDNDSCHVLQEIGAGILQNLHSQRQTITHARDTLHGADDNIAKSRRILAGMSRRIMTNKVVMFGIIGLLVAAIIIVIYFKIKS